MRLIILLLIVTPFAAYGQTTSDNAEQKAALAMIARLGGAAEVDETLLIGGTKVTDEGLAHIVSFTKLRKLSVFDTQVTDAGLGRLSKLPRLEVVLLGKSRVTEEGMKALQAALPKVRFTEKNLSAA